MSWTKRLSGRIEAIMWCYVQDPELCKKYQKELIAEASPLVLELLDKLARRTTGGLFAVTSLGHLRLTLGSRYEQLGRYDEVFITPRNGTLILSHIPAGHNKAISEIECADTETALQQVAAKLAIPLTED